MIKIEFSAEEIEQLHYERRYHPHLRVRQRMETVYLKALGYQHQEIGRVVGIGQKAVRSYLQMYQTGGIEALQELNFYRPQSFLEEHCERLKGEFEARPAKSINEAVQRIEKLTGIGRSPTQVDKFLKNLGLKRLKVGHIPAKADPEKQRVFLEEELEPRLEQARQGKRHLFFVDAAHFVMRPFLGFLWCFVRQFIQAPSGRKRFNVLGALHATTLQVVTFTNDSYINSDAVARLMCQIAVEFADLPITLVMDNARYQRCRFVMDLATALGIELLFLPPYSPNLNLIERLWKFVKKKCLYSEYYETFTDFSQAIVDCIAETEGEYKQELASLLTLKFQTFENVPL
ncbi:MAG: IS630 family transposase [Nitrososphaera sp.]|nr:IS630 family transposase [Nitrososphaera sp.]